MVKKKQLKSKLKKVKPGIYKASITAVKLHKETGHIEVQMTLEGEGFTYKENLSTRPEIVSDPAAGVKSFIICSARLHVSTVIGADNRHHAANKATKLFGNQWSSMLENTHSNQMIVMRNGYDHVSVKEFNELLRTLQN